MSTFDPDQFMSTQTTESNDTRFVPVPVGEYQAAIDRVEPALAGGKPVLNVTWGISDASVTAETGVDRPTVRQTIWLDVTDSGGLDNGRGKNVGLGKLREAIGQNAPGQPWSPGMLMGQVANVKVTHRMVNGETYTQVANVAAL